MPRKPSQFWIGAAVLLPVVLVLALGPQEQELRHRRGLLIPLAAMCTWAFLWILFANVGSEGTGRPWLLVGALLAAKGMAAGAGIISGIRLGHMSWRYTVILIAGWSTVTALLAWGLSTWQTDGPYAAATLILYVPLARLAWCPSAIAANRHR